MCEPTTIALAISVAASAASAVAQSQRAKAQSRFQQDQATANRRLAIQSFTNQAEANNEQLAQERAAASEEIQGTQIERLQAASTVETSAAENNAGGGVLNTLLADFNRTEAIFRQGVDTNLKFAKQNTISSNKNLQLQGQGRVDALRPGPVQKPNFLGTALKIGGDVADFKVKQAERKAKAGGRTEG